MKTVMQKSDSLYPVVIVLMMFFLVGCENEDGLQPPSEEMIPAAARAFADAHWDQSIYDQVLYEAAIDENAGEGFPEGEAAWNVLTWAEKIDFLPYHFTHEIPIEHNEPYYEALARYPEQNGFGWDDAIDDLLTTPYYFDGSSQHYNTYLSMINLD